MESFFGFAKNSLFSIFTLVFTPTVFASEEGDFVFGIDMSIEGLRSQFFADYIFVFLILSLILFTYIIYLYLPKNLKELKLGERIMFGALIGGVVLAVIIGYVQLIEGFLF